MARRKIAAQRMKQIRADMHLDLMDFHEAIEQRLDELRVYEPPIVDDVFGDGTVEITQDGYKILVGPNELEEFVSQLQQRLEDVRAAAQRKKGKKR